MKYYDWGRTLSYDAPITIICSSRGPGKTFGIRKQFVKDYIKDHSRFVEACRSKDEMKDIMEGYFDKLKIELDDFNEYIFKVEKNKAFMSKDIKKPIWHAIGYFVALSDDQRNKKKTYINVKRIVLDEAILKRTDRYHKYLKNEFGILTDLIDSCTRERADKDDRIRPHLYLLGNPEDMTNPYFYSLGIRKAPAYGYTWYNDANGKKFVLLHNVKPGEYEIRKANETLAGRMATITGKSSVNLENRFEQDIDDFIMKKPSRAKFIFGIVFENSNYSIWIDWTDGYYFVKEGIPNGMNAIYALTTEDNRANLLMARRGKGQMQAVIEMYYAGCVFFDTPYTRENFVRILSLYGVR